MSLVLTQEGGVRLLQWLTGAFATIVPRCHLLGQPFTPHETNTVSILAANEVGQGVGYTPLPLSSPRANWTITQITAGGQGVYAVLNWTFTGPANVYGYYVSDDSLPVSLWAELLGSVYTWSAAAPVFALQLMLQLVNLPGVS